MKNYKPVKISFEYGKGSYLFTNKGERYLDALSGIGVCCLGHSHKDISKVISDQSRKLIHVSNLFNIKNQELLANKLCKISKMNSAFFCNSGSEANEAAIKLATVTIVVAHATKSTTASIIFSRIMLLLQQYPNS